MADEMSTPPLRVWCAPMVLGSELAFRMLTRRHGISLAYSPMIKAHRIVAGVEEEHNVLADTSPEDRPLAIQFCGRDPSILAQAVKIAKQLQGGNIDAFDLNLGCPQRCAEHGGWGSFLADEPQLAADCVRAMVAAASPTPVWCKIRIRETVAKTVNFALELQAAGCALLAVHCRPRPTGRDQCGHGAIPEYDHLQAVVQALQIPVVANGGIETIEIAERVVKETGCHAVMAATGLLRNPRAFTNTTTSSEPVDVALEYMSLVEQFPPPSVLFVSKHLRWIFREMIQSTYDAAMAAAREHGTAPTDWRVHVWKFLAQPFLTEAWQFTEVVKYIAAKTNDEESKLSLKDIRLGRRVAEIFDATEEIEKDVNCLSLFGNAEGADSE
mmetsp:Transcript_49947/g.98668  ORF Transcript_49947/g.98668 Transcript_49947/m.98668 type:complete len:384 (-) Transcript_49947:26-1177(-)